MELRQLLLCTTVNVTETVEKKTKLNCDMDPLKNPQNNTEEAVTL